MEKKLQIPTEILCFGLPDEIIYYLNYCKSLRFEDRPDYDYLRGLFIKLLGTCNVIYGLTKEMLKFDWCFEDPLTSIWQIYNKKKQGGGNSNQNSSFGKEKEKSDDIVDEKEKIPNVIKKKKPGVALLKKQLSNIDEVNDLITNENNPNYERSDSSESGSEVSKNKDQKKDMVDKNLIKEESESKIVSESEETLRESFQAVPQDLEPAKLNDELKDVFFKQGQSERIDTYISQLMEPQKSEMGEKNNKNVDLLKFETDKNDEIDKINDTLNNTINHNELNNINNINNNKDKEKELLDITHKSKGKENIENNNFNENNGKSQKKNEFQQSKIDLDNTLNNESGRLGVSLRNSKNYTQEMENNLSNLKNKDNYLQFNEIADNNIIIEHQNNKEKINEEIKSNKDYVKPGTNKSSLKNSSGSKNNLSKENNINNENNISEENINNNNNNQITEEIKKDDNIN